MTPCSPLHFVRVGVARYTSEGGGGREVELRIAREAGPKPLDALRERRLPLARTPGRVRSRSTFGTVIWLPTATPSAACAAC